MADSSHDERATSTRLDSTLHAANSQRRNCVLVLGMHRSGTSALTRLLSLMGAKLPKTILGAGHGNDAGHWEPAPLLDYHDKVLAELDSSWHDWRRLDFSRLPARRRQEIKIEIADIIEAEFARASLFVVKDPRICRFAPLFCDALQDAGISTHIVLALRNPLEVAESHERRDGMTRANAALLWLRHMLEAEASSRHLPRTVASFEATLSNWRSVHTKLDQGIGVLWPYSADEVAPQVESFLAPTRRHHVRSVEDVLLDPAMCSWVSEAYHALLILERSPTSAAAMATLDRIGREFDNAAPLIYRLQQEHRDIVAAHFRGQIEEREAKLGALTSSVVAHEQDLSAQRAALAQANHRADELGAAIGERESALGSARADLAKAQARIAQLEAGYLDQERQAKEHLALVAIARQATSELQPQLDAARLETTELRSQRDVARLEATELRSQRDAARLEATELRSQRDAARLEATELRSQLATARAEHDDLQDDLTAHRRTAVHLRDIADQRLKLNDDLKSTLAERENVLAVRSQELEVLRTSIAALEQQSAAVKTELGERERELAHSLAVTQSREALIRNLEQHLEAVGASTDFRVGRFLGKLARRTAPPQTRRRALSIWVLNKSITTWRSIRGRPAATSLAAPVAAPPEQGFPVETTTVQLRTAEPFHYRNWLAWKASIAGDAHLPPVAELSYQPWISIILPVYKLPTDVLRATLNCLSEQTYQNWQACIAYADTDNEANWSLLEQYHNSDSRFHITKLAVNGGISANSNECLAMALGEFVALLDHDDEIPRDALEAVVRLLNDDPLADFIYTDKDTINADGTKQFNPLFKPDWSPEMLYSVNYLTHFNVMRTSLVRKIGGFRPETDGAQDWDIFLRVTERTNRIRRLAGVYYHWRVLPTSTATGIEAKPWALDGQLRCLVDHFARKNLDADVVANPETGFRIKWRRRDVRTRYLIDGDVEPANLVACLSSVLAANLAPTGPIEVLVPVAKAPEFQQLWRERGNAVSDQVSISILSDHTLDTALLQRLLEPRDSEATVLISGDIVSFTDDGMSDLAGWVACHPEIGFASAVIIDRDERVIEAGGVCGPDGVVFPLFRDEPLRSWGIIGGPLWHRNVRTASPYLLAFNSQAISALGPFESVSSVNAAISRICMGLVARGRRGVVVSTVRAVLASGCELPIPAFKDQLAADPYFHPDFKSVTPIILRDSGSKVQF